MRIDREHSLSMARFGRWRFERIRLVGLACAMLLGALPLAGAAQEAASSETGDGMEPTTPSGRPLVPQEPDSAASSLDEGSANAPRGTEELIECRVAYTIIDGFFVELDEGSNLHVGRRGWLEVEGRRVVPIEVGQVASSSAFIRVLPGRSLVLPEAGDVVRLLLEPADPIVTLPEGPSTLRADRNAPVPEFEPLLGPYVVDAETRNLFHGRAGIRQTFQVTSNGFEDAYRTIFDTAGTIERLGATAWTFEWSLDAIYRGGEALAADEHYEEIYPEVRRLAFVRRYDDRSITRVGRFLPTELPAVGTLDGFHSEIVLGPYLRIGGMLGYKPRRGDLAPSGKEPTVVSYTTFYWEEDRDHIYSATGGLYLSAYEGDTDRLAFMLDQHAHFGRWSFFATSELDFDAGNTVVTEGARLTRLDVSGRVQLGATSLRAAVNRFGIPDTAAERDHLQVLTAEEAAFLEDDAWRTSVGATHSLGSSWILEEEVSFIDSTETDDQLLWLVGVTRRNLGIPGSSLSARLYQLGGEDLDGVGGSITGYFPFREGRLALLPSISGRVSRTDEPQTDLEVGDIGLRMLWRFTDACSLNCGAAYTSSDDIERARFDIGFTVRW